jgi:uncharacterized protein
MHPAFLQVTSLGLVWISFHCAGMCGPLVAGLDVTGACRGAGALRGAGNLLLYQVGRALTLGALGMAAGALGGGIAAGLEARGGYVALAAAAVCGGLAVRGLWGRRTVAAGVGITKKRAGGVAALWPRLLAALFTLGALRPLALGVVLGFLPCMITGWAISLAATSGSTLVGGGVMVVLVAMTTPVLLLTSHLPRLALARRLPPAIASRVAPTLLLFSAIWLTMVGLAGLSVVEHRHVVVEVFGPHTIMLW